MNNVISEELQQLLSGQGVYLFCLTFFNLLCTWWFALYRTSSVSQRALTLYHVVWFYLKTKSCCDVEQGEVVFNLK